MNEIEFDKWYKNQMFIVNTLEEIGKYTQARKMEEEVLNKLSKYNKKNSIKPSGHLV